MGLAQCTERTPNTQDSSFSQTLRTRGDTGCTVSQENDPVSVNRDAHLPLPQQGTPSPPCHSPSQLPPPFPPQALASLPEPGISTGGTRRPLGAVWVATGGCSKWRPRMQLSNSTQDDPHDKGPTWRALRLRNRHGCHVGSPGMRRWCRGPVRLCFCACAATHLESFISICCRISCRSSSVLLGKIFRASSSCLLGRFLSLTARSSFLHFLGRVPRGTGRGGGRRETGVKEALACHSSHPPAGGDSASLC